MHHINTVISQLKAINSKPLEYQLNIVDEILKTNQNLKRQIILKALRTGSVKLNGEVVKSELITVKNMDVINFIGEKIKFYRERENPFDQFIRIVLKDFVKAKNLSDLTLDQKNKLVAYFLEYLSSTKLSFERLGQSNFFDSVLELLREFYKSYLLNQSERRIPEGKELVDKILLAREELYSQLHKLINSLRSELYDLEYNKFFKDLRPLFSNQIFILLAQPVTEVELDFFILTEKIVGVYKKVEKENDSALKFKNYIDANKEYDTFLKYFKGDDSVSTCLKDVINHFKEKTLSAVGVNEKELAELTFVPENRTYNFNSDNLIIYGYIINKGRGVSKNVLLHSQPNSEIEVPSTPVSEIVIPGSKSKIKFAIKILIDSLKAHQTLNFQVRIKWHDENDAVYETEAIDVSVEREEDSLPWDEVKSKSPYDLRKIDDPTKLFGRDKLIQDFKFAIEKSISIGSYVIHGQKRVGKSSIVKTLESFYSGNPNVHFIYTEVTERKGNDALYTFNEIGKHLAKQLIRDFERKNASSAGQLQLPAFNGSLSPLIDIVDEINSLNPYAKIILAIDEFDELNEEFFENSNIGNVFASNIGKGLSGKRFVGVILIGSENTENKTKKGMRLLNAVKFLPIDTFNRSDFDEYSKIIKNPTAGLLNFSPDVLDTLFEYSNGNPFYTNLICDKIFGEAYEKKISYIDQDFLSPILSDIQNSLSSKDFIHFWEDGATDDTFTNKKTFSRRCRILLAYAEVKKENGLTTWNNIRKKIPKPKDGIAITDNQFEETFNEFIHRRIFFSKSDSTILIKPKLFEAWLINNGTFQIASQLEDKEGLISQMQEDDKFKITEEEYSSLCNIIFGEHSKSEIKLLKDFFEQFENNKDRSLVSDLLKQLKVIKSSEQIAFLKKTYSQIWPSISLSTDELNFRKDAEVICLSHSYSQNESFYEKIIIPQLHLHRSRKLKTKEDLNKIDEEIKNVIIYEPLIDCPYYYRNEISKIIKSINPIFVSKIKIHILTFVLSQEAKEELENLFTQNFNFDVIIHALKIFERVEFAPYINKINGVNDQTFKCLSKIYGVINESSCLVKTGEIFPYQCFPFLWCSTSNFKPIIHSQYALESYINRFSISEKLKDYYIRSESKKIELKATMSTPAINWKKIKELSKVILEKSNKINDPVITSKIDEIQKLWKLELSSQERVDAINKIKYSFAKNLSAFANTEGGEIYVGIEDDFTITGTKEGNTLEESKRIFTEIVKKYIGVEFIEYFSLDSINVSERERLLRVQVKESKSDVWVMCDERGNKIEVGEQIFIRSEFGTEKLSPKAYKAWRDQRNKKYRIDDSTS